MNNNQTKIIRLTSALMVVFPAILVLSFAMHLHTPGMIFNFSITRPDYPSDVLFNSLVQSRGGSFLHAHLLAYLSVPFMLLDLGCLGYLLYPRRPILAFIGVALGVIGSLFMAGFLGSWLSFAAIGGVDPKDYAGAQATLDQLTVKNGFLTAITNLALLSLASFILLCLGLLSTKQFPKWPLVLIMIGSTLIMLFWRLPSWMLLGALFLLVGMIRIANRVQ